MRRCHVLAAMAFLTISAILTALPRYAEAQSRFLPDRRSGYGFGLILESGPDYGAVGGNLGLSLQGRVDVGLTAGRVGFDNEVLGPDGGGFIFAPYVSAILLRPEQARGLGVELAGSFERGSFTSDYLDQLDSRVQGDVWSGGIGIYTKTVVSPGLSVQPSIGTRWIHSSLQVGGRDLAEPQDGFGWQFGLAFFFDRKVLVQPALLVFDGQSSLSLQVGVVLPGSNWRPNRQNSGI